jgi:predicted metal-binding protein
MSRKISEYVPAGQLQVDLEKYRQKALDMGATEAAIIPADCVLIDERVRAKCINPKCDFYGKSGSCPPNAPELDFIRKTIGKFHYAIFHRITSPTSVMQWTTDEDRKAFAELTARNYRIVSTIESEAFHDGYYLALGFANGSCKSIFCPNESCSLISGGQGCRHPLKARSSMEGWGMDVFKMATRVGWDVYPIGRSWTASDVPCGSRMGLVLVY